MARMINRRRLLLGVGGLAGVAVAGCGSGGGTSGADSRVVWQQNAPAGSGLVSLAVHRGVLYAGSNANGSGALDADTGQETSVADSYHGPYLTGSTICLINNTTGNVYAVDATTGAGCPQQTPVAISGPARRALYSLDGGTGQVRWRFAHGEAGTNPVFDGLVYVGTSVNPPEVDTLYALRP